MLGKIEFIFSATKICNSEHLVLIYDAKIFSSSLTYIHTSTMLENKDIVVQSSNVFHFSKFKVTRHRTKTSWKGLIELCQQVYAEEDFFRSNVTWRGLCIILCRSAKISTLRTKRKLFLWVMPFTSYPTNFNVAIIWLCLATGKLTLNMIVVRLFALI